MVITNAQATAFFEDVLQMGIPRRTVVKLVDEGITTISDLSEFTSESLKEISENLRRPTGRDPDPTPNAPAGATVAVQPFVLGAKSQMRLRAASQLVQFYETVGRPLTAANMQWVPIIKNFSEHWKALEDRATDTDPETPKISKALPVTKWTEAFSDFLNRVVGSRTIPLAYVIRTDIAVQVDPPALALNQPYSTEHGSVEDDLIARASHGHALYREDNSKVYYLLEEATRTTSYAASIKPFQRAKNGRGAWFALVQQYAGEDKWRAELKNQDELIHTRKWKGQTNFSLEKFVAQHRNAYVSMSQCADHVAFQLPNELTRVTYLLDAIECNDAPLQAAMALVRNDSGPQGKLHDFEATASFLLPHDPVAKKRNLAGKRPIADISDATASDQSGKPKSGLGRTGVPLRFHTKDEYNELSSEQKEELREHRDNREKKGKGRHLDKKTNFKPNKSKTNKPDSKRLKTLISEAVAKQIVASATEQTAAVNDDDQMRAYIMSVIQGTDNRPQPSATVSTVTVAPPATSKPPALLLQSILKKSQSK